MIKPQTALLLLLFRQLGLGVGLRQSPAMPGPDKVFDDSELHGVGLSGCVAQTLVFVVYVAAYVLIDGNDPRAGHHLVTGMVWFKADNASCSVSCVHTCARRPYAWLCRQVGATLR